MNGLTAQVLRDAAGRLWDGVGARREGFMCRVVDRAAGGTGIGSAARGQFEALLDQHGVSTGGALDNDHGVCVELGDPERQALRFDFLNLLAEAWEDLQ